MATGQCIRRARAFWAASVCRFRQLRRVGGHAHACSPGARPIVAQAAVLPLPGAAARAKRDQSKQSDDGRETKRKTGLLVRRRAAPAASGGPVARAPAASHPEEAAPEHTGLRTARSGLGRRAAADDRAILPVNRALLVDALRALPDVGHLGLIRRRLHDEVGRHRRVRDVAADAGEAHGRSRQSREQRLHVLGADLVGGLGDRTVGVRYREVVLARVRGPTGGDASGGSGTGNVLTPAQDDARDGLLVDRDRALDLPALAAECQLVLLAQRRVVS
jgi:hypothetical protein